MLKTLKKILLFVVILHIFIYLYKDKYVINFTKSIPVGIYETIKTDDYKKGDLVTFKSTEYPKIVNYKGKDILSYAKKIVGVYGDKITVKNNKLYINDEFLGNIHTKNNSGAKIPQLDKKNFTLKENEYFLFGVKDDSFDSRYYGAIKKKDILYKIIPIKTFGEDKYEKKEEEDKRK